VTFSPDGKTLATSGEDGTARLWDLSGKELAQLKGHQGSVRSVSFSPDGKTLATSGSDGTARLWDRSGRQIAQYDGKGYINSDWTTIATINPSPTNPEDRIVTLRPLLPRSPTALLDRACQKLKYYLLQSPELKDDRKMCGLEN
jgi:WD40 repeat protein